MEPTLYIVNFCAQECSHQRTDAQEVSWLVATWCWAHDLYSVIGNRFFNSHTFHIMSHMVDSEDNDGHSYRKVPVTFRFGDRPLPAEGITNRMEHFFEAIEDKMLSPQEAYEAFERIHPYADGNGRMGKIIFNLLNGTMLSPIFPKEPNW